MEIMSDFNKSYASKNLSKENIVSTARENNSYRVEIFSQQKEAAEVQLERGEVITRYFFDKHRKQWCVVIEKSETQ